MSEDRTIVQVQQRRSAVAVPQRRSLMAVRLRSAPVMTVGGGGGAWIVQPVPYLDMRHPGTGAYVRIEATALGQFSFGVGDGVTYSCTHIDFRMPVVGTQWVRWRIGESGDFETATGDGSQFPLEVLDFLVPGGGVLMVRGGSDGSVRWFTV